MTVKEISADIFNWKSRDFVKFFYRCYEDTYGDLLEFEYDRDCPIMKRVIEDFRKVDRPKEVVLSFIQWAFKAYVNDPKYTEPMQIGFLSYMEDQFLGFSVKATKSAKKAQQKVSRHSTSTMKFLKEQRKIYRKKLKRD